MTDIQQNSPILIDENVHPLEPKLVFEVVVSALLSTVIFMYATGVVGGVYTFLFVFMPSMRMAMSERRRPRKNELALSALLALAVPVVASYLRAVGERVSAVGDSYTTLFGTNAHIWKDVLASWQTNGDMVWPAVWGFVTVAILVMLTVLLLLATKSIITQTFSIPTEPVKPKVDALSSNGDTPMPRSLQEQEESGENTVQRILRAAWRCYRQYELSKDTDTRVYFENNADYVDSWLNVVSSKKGEVESVDMAFTIPPNQENPEWVSYNLEITNLEYDPEFSYVEEIDQNGEVRTLASDYYEWLADTLEIVLAQPQIAHGQAPPQQAPRTMY